MKYKTFVNLHQSVIVRVCERLDRLYINGLVIVGHRINAGIKCKIKCNHLTRYLAIVTFHFYF